MMHVDLNEVPRSGFSWDTVVSLPDIQADGPDGVKGIDSASRPAHWQGSIERCGECFLLKAHLEAYVHRRCDRCMSAYEELLVEDVERQYSLIERPEMDDEGSSIELLASSATISLLDTLKEEVWLAMSPVARCSETCRGMCADCGENLNVSECSCQKDDMDHPFAALKKLNFDS